MESVAFDPAGDRIALGSTDGTAYIFETASARQLFQTGKLAAVLRGHAGVLNGSAFSEDASRLATTSLDGTVRTWEVGTWASLGSERVADDE